KGAEKTEGGSLMLVFAGTPCDYSEAYATEIVSSSEFIYTLTVGTGSGQATIWTCDLSHEYVSINAEYRT
ncbi:MAG: bifunctional ornithine acetyltransferase/N-acetylglutamate synthase, partial [Nitrospira sp.]|nr:bifunctional ornithine acetyltransferase/N-acetylglutamate synthase [Nitrospira sp.]